MSEETVNYEAKYKEIEALNQSLTEKLTESVDEINKLKADLKVAQLVNSRTVGTTTSNPNNGEVKVKVSLADKLADYRKKIKN